MEGMGMATAVQAVILAAGRGTRLQKPDPTVVLDPETEAIVKQGIKALVPIGGRSFLDYSIHRLMDAGIRRVCLILAPCSEPLEAYVNALPERFPGLSASIAVQPEAKGTAHALRFARQATGDGDFLMLNSDNLYPDSALRDMADSPAGVSYACGFDQESLVAESNIESSRLSQLGILVPRSDDPDALERVVEKPSDPSVYRRDGRLWVTMNLWRFTPDIYDFCDHAQSSPRGEFELTSAVQDLSDSGRPIRMIRSREGVLDLTSRADIFRLQSILCP